MNLRRNILNQEHMKSTQPRISKRWGEQVITTFVAEDYPRTLVRRSVSAPEKSKQTNKWSNGWRRGLDQLEETEVLVPKIPVLQTEKEAQKPSCELESKPFLKRPNPISENFVEGQTRFPKLSLPKLYSLSEILALRRPVLRFGFDAIVWA